jgi:hypothetical protein
MIADALEWHFSETKPQHLEQSVRSLGADNGQQKGRALARPQVVLWEEQVSNQCRLGVNTGFDNPLEVENCVRRANTCKPVSVIADNLS